MQICFLLFKLFARAEPVSAAIQNPADSATVTVERMAGIELNK